VTRPYDREVAPVDGGDPGDAEPFRDRDDSRVHCSEWEAGVPVEEVGHPVVVVPSRREGDELAAGGQLEDGDLRLRLVRQPREQVADLRDDEHGDPEWSRLAAMAPG
jgi:hypothetical protein